MVAANLPQDITTFLSVVILRHSYMVDPRTLDHLQTNHGKVLVLEPKPHERGFYSARGVIGGPEGAHLSLQIPSGYAFNNWDCWIYFTILVIRLPSLSPYAVNPLRGGHNYNPYLEGLIVLVPIAMGARMAYPLCASGEEISAESRWGGSVSLEEPCWRLKINIAHIERGDRKKDENKGVTLTFNLLER
jgi:hypothetical protein